MARNSRPKLVKFWGNYYYSPDNPSVVFHRDTLHIPFTGLVLDSFPPQYYCSQKDTCYSHQCDWEGWDWVDD